jgi:hypothetical protein
MITMQNGTDAQTRKALSAEIHALEGAYLTLRKYLSGTEYDSLEIVGTLQVFKDTLDQISAHILTMYQLSGQRTKITWELLLNNIGNALETLRSYRKSNLKTTIETALNMSEPNAQEVMTYLSKLKESL